MRILSIDQAKTCGWALFNGNELIDYGVEKLASKETTYENVLLPARNFVEELIKKTKAEIIVVEDVQQQSNSQVFKKLSLLLGVLICLFKQNDMLYHIVPSTKWKSYCEIKGRKREEQKINAIRFVKEKYGIDVSDDVADAISLGFYSVNNIKIKGA